VAGNPPTVTRVRDGQNTKLLHTTHFNTDPASPTDIVAEKAKTSSSIIHQIMPTVVILSMNSLTRFFPCGADKGSSNIHEIYARWKQHWL